MIAPLLLCTDMDRTLLPNGVEPETPGVRYKFKDFVNRHGVTLVYVTGRDRQLIEDAIDEYQLPQPDYVIADVGSTIYRVIQDDWQHNDIWQQSIAIDWHGRSHDEIHSLLSNVSNLDLQEAARQNTFKLSYYVPLNVDHKELMSEIHTILLDQQINASLIWSVDDIKSIGLLDVLPASASKRHAIEFLMAQLNFTYANTIFAGDSGNDLLVLTSPIKSVLVANASNEVKHQSRQQAINMGHLDNLYLAKGDYLGMNGNYCAGILEGIAHYLPETREVLGEMNEQG